MKRILFFWLLLGPAALALADPARPGAAEDVGDAAWDFKLTPSYYATAHQTGASDLNLRADSGPHAVWLGYYRRGNEFEQTRTGYEFTAETPFGKIVPSLQLASHGFAGGSLNAEVGQAIFALVGFGRTNAKDYYNLNFDPNDSITYGLGTRLLPKSMLSLFTVKDNRLHTGQMVTHAVWRYLPAEHQRLTLDLSSKHGRASAEDDSVSGKAVSVTYDYQSVFVRLARDRKVNFTADDQTRLSLGLRF
ncbi:hypothetical protein ACLIKD_07375 [Azonexus sp. IMCC34842]|uniref:hypothetical protein n=1 Tax=Azonexus sp. IMCC34842 TaxID=3420950 RepID=UPI003D0D28F2